MDLQEQGKAVTGKLSFGGNQYPVTGEVNDGTVSGTFEVDGVPFRFVATVLGDEMTLESDGNSFALRRERTGSAIPLGGGAKKDEFLRTLNVEDEVQYQRLMIRVLRVNANDMSDPQDDSVELYIRGSNLAQETTIEDGRSEIVANVEITALEITPAAATPGDGSVKLRLSAPGAHAVDAGQPAGDVFSRPDSGFDVPLHGDFKMLQAKGPAYVFGSTTKPGIIIVVADPSMTPQQIDLGAQQGYQDEELQLRPTGQSVVLPGGSGKRLMVPVQGTLQGSPVVGAMAGYEIPGRGGVMAVAITTQESWPQLKPVAEQIMRGIKVYQPKLSERLRSARQKLAGHSLVYSANINNTSMNSSGYYTGTSLNSFKAWHCCASGWGRYEGMRSQSFQGGGIIGTSEQGHQAFDGQWSLSAAGEDYLLTFQFEDGSSQSWTISVDENENVWVDGQKVKVTTDSICNGR
jgi:hypothetical protein